MKMDSVVRNDGCVRCGDSRLELVGVVAAMVVFGFLGRMELKQKESKIVEGKEKLKKKE